MKIDKTKDIIVSVAYKLFSRFGFQKTSMDEIAKTAHRAKGSLYYHFSSKERLFREVVSLEMTTLKNKLSLIVGNSDLAASEKIKQYLIKRMEILNTAANYHEILKADFYEYFHFIEDLRIELDAWEKENLKKLLLQGVETGEFTTIGDIDILLDVFIMVIKGLEIPFFLQNKYEKYSLHFESLIGILTKGLT